MAWSRARSVIGVRWRMNRRSSTAWANSPTRRAGGAPSLAPGVAGGWGHLPRGAWGNDPGPVGCQQTRDALGKAAGDVQAGAVRKHA